MFTFTKNIVAQKRINLYRVDHFRKSKNDFFLLRICNNVILMNYRDHLFLKIYLTSTHKRDFEIDLDQGKTN